MCVSASPAAARPLRLFEAVYAGCAWHGACGRAPRPTSASRTSLRQAAAVLAISSIRSSIKTSKLVSSIVQASIYPLSILWVSPGLPCTKPDSRDPPSSTKLVGLLFVLETRINSELSLACPCAQKPQALQKVRVLKPNSDPYPSPRRLWPRAQKAVWGWGIQTYTRTMGRRPDR